MIWAIVGGAVGILLASYVYYQIIAPFNEVRESLKRLAAYDFRPVLLRSRLGVFREIAANVRRISELLQQLDRQVADEGFSLRAILSSMVEGVLIVDRSLRVRLCNDPLQRMFDLRQSPVNRSVMEVFRSHQLQNAIEQTLTSGQSRQISITFGGTTHFDIHVGGLSPRGQGRPPGAVIVFHDVTKVRNLESVRREFVANVSHEFRTPLAIINGYIETLLDGALDDRPMAEKSLKVMYKNGQRLTLLIEDLMTISKMEHRSAMLEFRPLDLREVFRKILHRLQSAVAERNAQVTIDCPEEVSYLEGDARHLDQVFANLLENALRYGTANQVLVAISVIRDADDVVISFQDNGPGIPLEDQPHIFERFYRVHKDRSRVAGGTGLGLSIVKHVIQAHGGAVSVESVPGQGATFKVRLPVAQAATETHPTP
ncbi:two-component system, OmpR family [Terrimicrobium sacchariphilum]|uniref:histidine kinase n=1 Tax=Terrimicrobium sacchariphilum TaxID=690879 RepID=A0A146G5V3_TERSA|nr:ATP-binding protein [Terrimicrobium sacchariphilum]GAT32116.1 two-component system, OmpR family [Terrimicrobium sacchariphilum]